MKRLSIVLVALVLSLAGTAVHAQNPTAKQVFESMIQALGAKAFVDVKETQTSGRYFQFKRGEVSATSVFTDFVKFPDMERTEFGPEKEKRVQINRGKEGWNISPPLDKKRGPEIKEQSASEIEDFLENFKTSFDYMTRFVANAPKSTMVNAGTEVIDYKRSDILEIRDAEKNLMRIYVDRQTHLPVKVERRKAGESTLREETYANWHEFDGVMTPLMIVTYTNGVKMSEIRAEKVAYNTGFADSLFTPQVPPTK